MKENNLHRLLREKFENHSTGYTPNEEMWSAIETQLPQPDRKRKRAIFFLLPLLLGSMVFFLYRGKDQTEPAIVQEQVALHNTIPSIVDFELEKEEGNNDESMEEQGVEVSRNARQTHTRDFNQQTDHVSMSQVQNRSVIAESSFSSSPARSSTIVSAPQVFEQLTNTSITTEELEHVNYPAEASNLDKLEAIPPLGFQLNHERALPILLSDLDSSEDLIDQDNRLSIGLIIGYESLNPRYDLSDDSYASVLEQRQDSETESPRYRAGIELEYDLNDNWSILSGLQVSFAQDQFFNETETSVLDTLLNYEMPTQTETGMDTILIGTAIRTTIVNTRTYAFTDRLVFTVPVVLNYNTSLGKSSRIGLGLGLEKVIAASISGSEPNRDGGFYDLDTDTEDRLGTNGLNALARLSYQYQFSEHWNLRFIINYRRALSNNYTPTAPIEKSFDGLGISLGYYYKF